MQGRSLEYLDGADRLSQAAFYFPSFGQNKGIYAESAAEGRGGARRRQSQSPGGGRLREWGQGQWGQEGDRLQRKFLLGNTMSGNDEQGLGCGRRETDCKTGKDSLGSVSHLIAPLQE